MKAQQITNIRGAASLQKKLTNKRSDILFLFSFLDCVCFLFVLLFCILQPFPSGCENFPAQCLEVAFKKDPPAKLCSSSGEAAIFFFQ